MSQLSKKLKVGDKGRHTGDSLREHTVDIKCAIYVQLQCFCPLKSVYETVINVKQRGIQAAGYATKQTFCGDETSCLFFVDKRQKFC